MTLSDRLRRGKLSVRGTMIGPFLVVHSTFTTLAFLNITIELLRIVVQKLGGDVSSF